MEPPLFTESERLSWMHTFQRFFTLPLQKRFGLKPHVKRNKRLKDIAQTLFPTRKRTPPEFQLHFLLIANFKITDTTAVPHAVIAFVLLLLLFVFFFFAKNWLTQYFCKRRFISAKWPHNYSIITEWKEKHKHSLFPLLCFAYKWCMGLGIARRTSGHKHNKNKVLAVTD